MFCKKLTRIIIQFKAINGRISYIRVENKQANITIINAYAPTQVAKRTRNQNSTRNQNKTCESLPRNDMLMQKLGKKSIMIMQQEKKLYIIKLTTTVQDCNLFAITNTYIMKTKLKHKKEHKITWMISGRPDGNKIVHVLPKNGQKQYTTLDHLEGKMQTQITYQ